MIQQHQLERIGNEPLSFRGELLIRTETELVLLGQGAFQYRLGVFRCQEGGYAAAIQLLTTGLDGAAAGRFCLAERLETINDVENFFFVFEPEEHLNNIASPAFAWDDLSRTMYGYYDEQVQQVVAELQAFQASPLNVESLGPDPIH